MPDREYIILPPTGFKSPVMKKLLGRRGEARPSSASPHQVSATGGGPSFSVIHSSSPEGLKTAVMSASDAQELRKLGRFRVAPLRKYRPARRPIPAVSRLALARLWEGNNVQIKIKLFVKGEGTNLGLSDVKIIAYLDTHTNAGLRRQTGETGLMTLTFPEKHPIRQLFVFPPPGYWGKFLESPKLVDGDSIYLTRIADDYPDLLRQTYGIPGAGTGVGVRVAVVDTGVDTTHPDLSVDGAKNCCYNTERETDHVPTDPHGTHVAGIIAGRKRGIAPGVKLNSYKVFPKEGPGYNAYIADAIDFAVEAKCDLVNLSLSANVADDLAVREAIGHAFERGTVCIVAAGNTPRKSGPSNDVLMRPVASPAWFKRSVAVAAIGKVGSFPLDAVEAGEVSDERSSDDPKLYLASFSNFGPEIDVCAPGVGIVSTWFNEDYAVENGTSMACPVVTGIGAALLSSDPKLLSMDRTNARSMELIRRIQTCCRSVGLPKIHEGFGQPSSAHTA